MKLLIHIAFVALTLFVVSIVEFNPSASAQEVNGSIEKAGGPGGEFQLTMPLGFSELPAIPSGNPLTAEKIELGKKLFFDPILSVDGKVACSNCHKPELNFATSDPVAIGINDRRGKRNAPSLLNRAYGKSMFWDGRTKSLEEQALQPLEHPDEMGGTIDAAIERLAKHPEYPPLFAKAFAPSDTTSEKTAAESVVTRENLAKALACYERTLLIGNSQVDRFRNSEYAALPADARTGMWLFESRANCWKCHNGENFSDEDFHNTGVGFGKDDRDRGRIESTGKDDDLFHYKTPSLRGVALTAPYMHDGSLVSLEEVVEFYSRGGSPNDPSLDKNLKPLNLTDTEKKQLVAFLKALSE